MTLPSRPAPSARSTYVTLAKQRARRAASKAKAS